MTSPSDVLALARAVVSDYMNDAGICRHCRAYVRNGIERHRENCPVPIAERVIEEEGK